MSNEDKKNLNNHSENEHSFKSLKAKPVVIKDNMRYFYRNPFFLIIQILICVFIRFFINFLLGKLIFGLKIKNKKVLRQVHKKGTITIANHAFIFDSLILGSTTYPWKITYVTMLKENMGIVFVGKFLRLIGGVPIPDKLNQIKKFNQGLKKEINKCHNVCVFAEASLKPYCNHIRNFMPGAFRFVYDTNAYILPAVFIFKRPRGWYRLVRGKKPTIQLHYLEPIKFQEYATKHETITKMQELVQAKMTNYFNENNEVF